MMIARMKCFLLLLSMAVLIESVPRIPSPGRFCDCECNRRERVSYQQPIYGRSVSIKQRYKTNCGFWGWGRCTRYRTKWIRTIKGYTTGYRLKRCDCPCRPDWPRGVIP